MTPDTGAGVMPACVALAFLMAEVYLVALLVWEWALA